MPNLPSRLETYGKAHGTVCASTCTGRQLRPYAYLYNSSLWKKIRADQLRMHPLCAECAKLGRVTPATECDHIVPHKGDKSRFYDRSNLQSLCHQCHSAKTATEDGGYGNRMRHSK